MDEKYFEFNGYWLDSIDNGINLIIVGLLEDF